MKELQGFYNEEVLQELLYKEEITTLQYVYHHSEEMKEDFKRYCQKRGIEETERAAGDYCNFLLKREEHCHVDNLD